MGKIAESAIAKAQTYLGKVETGNNDAPWLDQLMALAGNPAHWVPGESYCIAALCDLFAIACKEIGAAFPFPMSLSTQTFFQNAESAGFVNKVYERGDIVIFRDGNTWQGHAELVTGVTPEGLNTIGFNTSSSAAGSQRNGQGCYAKIRLFKQFPQSATKLWMRGSVKTSRI